MATSAPTIPAVVHGANERLAAAAPAEARRGDALSAAERRALALRYAWVLPWVLAAIGFLTTLTLLR
jgi:hypothetical protein